MHRSISATASFRKTLLAALVPLLALGAEQAVSQQIEEIVVTAQKREENLQDVPIAVTALAGKQLEDAGIDSQQLLSKITPNLNFTVIASFAATYIRSVGTQFANPGLESSVSVYFDDTYIPRAASAMFTFTDVQRVEVLKGPQGTLYGRNATGGAMRIITWDPQPEFGGKFGLGTGTDNRVLAEGMLNVPMTESMGFRISGRMDQNDGYVDNIYPGASQDKLEDRDEYMIGAKWMWDVTEDFRIKVSGDYMNKEDSEGHGFHNLWTAPQQVGQVLGGCVSDDFYNLCNDLGESGASNQDVGQDVTAKGVTVRLDYDVGDLTLSSISAYRRHNEYNSADLDSTGFYLQHATGKPRTKQLTQEFQVTSDYDGPLNYVAGLYYLLERSGYFFSIYGNGLDQGFGFPGADLGGDGAVRVESWAPYVQFDYELNDQWTITAGLRYTQEKKNLVKADTVIGVVGGSGFPDPQLQVIPGTDVEPDFEETTPKLTISYRPNDESLLYATIARGFKSGGINLPAFTFGGAPATVEPEVLDDFEIGWKYQSGNIRLNSAAFYYDYQDLQIQITDQTTGGTAVKNAAEAEVMGVEADLTWVATEALEVGAGFGYTDSEYNEFIGDAYYPCTALPPTASPADIAACGSGLGLRLVGGQDLAGNTLVNAPEFSGYLRFLYDVPLGGMGNLSISSVLNYRTKAYFDTGNLYEDDSRSQLSARIAWTDPSDKYTVALWGDNLTDEEYYLFNSPQDGGGWSITAPPRRVFISGEIRF